MQSISEKIKTNENSELNCKWLYSVRSGGDKNCNYNKKENDVMAGKWVKPENMSEARAKGYVKDPGKDRKKTGEVFMSPSEKAKKE